MQQPSKLDHALSLAKQGLYIFPLAPGTKKPWAGSQGFKEATLDLDQIKKWWLSEPQSNIGVSPGHSNHVVIDIDVKDEDYAVAEDTIAWVAERVATLPETLTIRTPSGGYHFYFAAGDDGRHLASSVRRVHPAIDIRAQGGYVVAGGSVTPDGRYSVKYPRPIAKAPDDLLRLCSSGREAEVDGNRHSPRGGELGLDLPANTTAATRYLRDVPPAIEGRGGDLHTYQVACRVKDYGVSEEKCFELLAEHFNPRCEPPWDFDDLEAKCKGAQRYGTSEVGEKGLTPETIDAFSHAASNISKHDRLVRLNRSELNRLPDPVWLIDDTIEQSSLSLLVGKYGSFKSFCAVDMACSVASGFQWAGNDTRQGKVIYLAGEGAPGLKSRIDAWEEAHDIIIPDDQFSLVPTMPLFYSPEDFAWLHNEIEEDGTSFIVIDTVARAAVGLDENNTKDMSIFVHLCDEIVERHNCGALLVHHTGKEENKGSRGSVVLPASVHTELHIDATENTFKLTMPKQKNAEAWRKPFGFKKRRVANSLVFVRDDQCIVSDQTMINMNREAALGQALAGSEIALSNRALADAMSDILGSDDASVVFKYVRKRTAEDDRAFKDADGHWYWKAHGVSGGEETPKSISDDPMVSDS